MAGSEIARKAADEELEHIRRAISQQPSGEYRIEGVRFGDRSDVVAALHDMVSRLSWFFPEFSWSTSDSLDPSVLGITVRWTKKAERQVQHGDSNPALGQGS